MPYAPSRGYDDRVLQLILRRGEDQARGALESGAIWGNAVAGLGQQVGGAIQQYGQQKAQSKRSQAIDKMFSGPEPPAPQDILRVFGPKEGLDVIKGLQAINPKTPPEMYKDRMERIRDTARGVKALTEDKRPGGWDVATKGLIAAEVIKPEEAQPYSPDLLDQFANYGVTPEKDQGLMNLGDGTVYDPNTNKDVRIGTPKVEKGPATGSFEDYVVQKYGPRPTPEQTLQARKDYNQSDDRPLTVQNPERQAERQRLVDAVAANPSLWDDLTPGVKGDIAADLNAKGFSGFGKRMSDGTIKQISESKAALASLRDLRTTLQDNEQYIGPVAGLAALNPYSEARKAQSKIDLVRQRVGKALEGGVLRKEDEEKYKKILSTLRDEPETAIYKVDSLIQTLERDMELFIEEQRSAGRRVAQPPKPAGGTTPTVTPPQTVKYKGRTVPFKSLPPEIQQQVLGLMGK